MILRGGTACIPKRIEKSVISVGLNCFRTMAKVEITVKHWQDKTFAGIELFLLSLHVLKLI
jgi:hypothetical protein